jgi:hypothetical protein
MSLKTIAIIASLLVGSAASLAQTTGFGSSTPPTPILNQDGFGSHIPGTGLDVGWCRLHNVWVSNGGALGMSQLQACDPITSSADAANNRTGTIVYNDHCFRFGRQYLYRSGNPPILNKVPDCMVRSEGGTTVLVKTSASDRPVYHY